MERYGFNDLSFCFVYSFVSVMERFDYVVIIVGKISICGVFVEYFVVFRWLLMKGKDKNFI